MFQLVSEQARASLAGHGMIETGPPTGPADQLRSAMASRWSGPGRLAETCRYSVLAPGKLLRPLLLIRSALAVGGCLEQVIHAAVGTEGAHTASLVHDDIIDGDLTRRGQPATHVAFGRDDAIVAGDALIFDLFACLAESATAGVSDARIVRAMAIAAQAGRELCQGQFLEESIRQDRDHALASYQQMIGWKTAALFAASCEIGALLGGGPWATCADLGRYGLKLGLAFQMVDDLLPYTSDEQTAGKSTLSDVANHRPTLPFLISYESAGPGERDDLTGLLYGNDDPALRAASLRSWFDRFDAVNRGIKLAEAHGRDAVDALNGLADDEHRESLADYVHQAVNRCR